MKSGSVFALAVALLLCMCAIAAPPMHAQTTFELSCPAGYAPIPQWGKSFNAVTGKFRANFCISTDHAGTVLCQASGCGGAAAAPVGAVQYNIGGNFAGSAEFTWDPLNTLLAIGNTGPGELDVLNGGFVVASNYLNEASNIQLAPDGGIQGVYIHLLGGGDLNGHSIVANGTIQNPGIAGSGTGVCIDLITSVFARCTTPTNPIEGATAGKEFQAGHVAGSDTVVFPTAFSGSPTILANADQGFADVHVKLATVSATGFQVDFVSTFDWMAFGPK